MTFLTANFEDDISLPVLGYIASKLFAASNRASEPLVMTESHSHRQRKRLFSNEFFPPIFRGYQVWSKLKNLL